MYKGRFMQISNMLFSMMVDVHFIYFSLILYLSKQIILLHIFNHTKWS